MRAVPFVILGSCLALGLGVQGWALDEEIRQHPNQALVEEYRASERAVEALRSRIARPNDQGDRVLALRDLADAYPLAAEITARAYVADENVEVAFAAVQILKNATVMSNHSIPKDRALSPQVAYMMERHQRSIAALRPAVVDRRDRIRQGVVTFLASLSDTVALELVSNDETGLYSDLQIANIFTLANVGVAQRYLALFLGKGDLDAQMTAIWYLSAIPKWMPEICDIYLLNRNASTQLRKFAALELGSNGLDFSEYVLDIANNNGFDPDLLETIVTIIEEHLENDQLDMPSANHYANSMRILANGKFPHIPTDTVQRMNHLSLKLNSYLGIGRVK